MSELLECFLENAGQDGLQVVAEEIAQSEALLSLQIRRNGGWIPVRASLRRPERTNQPPGPVRRVGASAGILKMRRHA